MIITYLFSDPRGDIAIGPEEEERPFKITPSETHPFLTLGDYFGILEEFVLKRRASSFTDLLGRESGRDAGPDDIKELAIRSEKHGALYHIASIEAAVHGNRLRYAAVTALSLTAKGHLRREFQRIRDLNETFHLPYLPRVYFLDDMIPKARDEKDSLVIMLAEWFDDFSEWHLAVDGVGKGPHICIWDQKEGHRRAAEEEYYEIFRQASEILTLYYDTKHFRQIHPWHHAAGDFVVKTRNDGIDVRLTTVRGYVSIMGRLSHEAPSGIVAIVFFFLHMSVQMRLDKCDGTGDVLWGGEDILPAVIKGFRDGMRMKEQGKTCQSGITVAVIELLRSLSKDEMEKMLLPLLTLYEKGDPDDFSMIRENLTNHALHLHRAFQGQSFSYL